MSQENMPRFIAALTGLAIGASGLTRVPLTKLGRYTKREGGRFIKFAITRQAMSEAVANFRKTPMDVVIDYEHASMTPEIAAGGLVPAAGWLKSIDDGPDVDGVLWGM